MAYSDYLAVKKQKHIHLPQRYSSHRTKNNEYYQLQNTNIINEDGDIVENKRFHMSLSSNPIYSKYNNRLASGFSNMYSLPKIHTPEYIKNRYQPSFCWTCWTPTGEITKTIACSVCDYTEEMEQIHQDTVTEAFQNAIDTPTITSSFQNYIDKLLNDFDMEQDKRNNIFVCENDNTEEVKIEEEIITKEDIDGLPGFVVKNNIYDIIHHFEKTDLF